MSFEITIVVLCWTVAITLVTWLHRIYSRLHLRIFDLEFDNKDFKARISSLENSLLATLLSSLPNLPTQTSEQKESQQKSFVYGTTKLSNPEITKELVNEIAETNSKRTLFDDLWKIEPPVKKK